MLFRSDATSRPHTLSATRFERYVIRPEDGYIVLERRLLLGSCFERTRFQSRPTPGAAITGSSLQLGSLATGMTPKEFRMS